MQFETVFVDRDGTLNEKAPEDSYITSRRELHLVAGVGPAVRRLNLAGVAIFVVTNQRGVARNVMSIEAVHEVNAELTEALRVYGARIDGFYICPHDEGVCECRKPKPGLILQCAAEHPEVELSRSAMIGDVEADILAGCAAGVANILIAQSEDQRTSADYVVGTFADAVDLIVGVETH